MSSEGGRATAIILREKALKKYYENPNYCLNCGNVIMVEDGHKIQESRRKKFCNHSCAQIYNNHLKNKRTYKNILDDISDETLKYAIEHNFGWKALLESIGLSRQINNNLKQEIIDRSKNLGVTIIGYNEKKNEDFNNLTKIQLINKRNSYQSWRSDIQKNANNKYFTSDKPKKCIICGYDLHIEVAHIKSVSSFDDNSKICEINDINNLIALCPNHHWEYDNNGLDISNYL